MTFVYSNFFPKPNYTNEDSVTMFFRRFNFCFGIAIAIYAVFSQLTHRYESNYDQEKLMWISIATPIIFFIIMMGTEDADNHRKRYKYCTVKIEANVSDIDESHLSESPAYALVYEYTYMGAAFRETSHLYTGMNKVPRINTICTIYIDPKTPQTIFEPQRESKPAPRWIMISFAVFGYVCLLFSYLV